MTKHTIRAGWLTLCATVSLVTVPAGCGIPMGAGRDESPAALQVRAREIHAAVFTLDTHKDIDNNGQLGLAPPASADPEQRRRHRERFDPTVRGINQVDFPKMREGLYDCAFFIVYVGQGQNNPAGFLRAKQQALLKFKAIQRMCDRFPEHIALARTPAEARRIHADGKLVACIGIENGYPMGLDLALIEDFWLRGARYMSITHNKHNQLGDSHTPPEPEHGGLTDLGRQAVAKMNELGIMVDISHAAKATVMDVFATTKAPVIASHSGVRTVHDHSRNLDDETLRALGANGGVIQCVALGDFVKDMGARQAALQAARDALGLPSRWELYRIVNGPEPITAELQAKIDAFELQSEAIDVTHPKANVADYVDHIDHVVNLIGIDHVGIASDFDGGGGIDGFNSAAEAFNVTHELARRGYTRDQIAKIWSGNLCRVWQAVEDHANR